MKRKIIIMGSAPCLEADLIRMCEGANTCHLYDFMAIGLDAVDRYLGRIDYFATYHPSEIAVARERREAAGGNTDYKVISHIQHQDLVDEIIPYEPPSGSSSLLGVLAGLNMGYEKIIVAGCPLEGKSSKGASCETFRAGWEKKLSMIRNNVRSMSGWTRELLGTPTEDWLNS